MTFLCVFATQLEFKIFIRFHCRISSFFVRMLPMFVSSLQILLCTLEMKDVCVCVITLNNTYVLLLVSFSAITI